MQFYRYRKHAKLAFAATILLGLGLASRCQAARSAGGPAEGASDAGSAAAIQLGLPPGDKPSVVRIAFRLDGVTEIDEEAETFEFTGVLTLRWKDEHQAFDPDKTGVNEKIYQGDFQFNELSPAWYPQIILVNRSGLFETSATILRVEPDGSSTLSQTIDAIARTTLDLRTMPFDSQSLHAVFEVFGFDQTAVKLIADESPDQNGRSEMSIPQWTLGDLKSSVVDSNDSHTGDLSSSPRFMMTVNVQRQSMFLMRLVVMPLALIVTLSWSIFWMDRSSLGDRINLSFVGILTAVTYQIVVGDIMPRISYQTLMNEFLNISFSIMCVGNRESRRRRRRHGGQHQAWRSN